MIRGWKLINPSIDDGRRLYGLLDKAWVEVLEKFYKDDEKPERPDLYTFTSVRTLGRCLINEVGSGYAYCIALNSLVIEKSSDNEILGIIVHELAHLVNGIKYYGKGHTDQWKRIGDKIGKAFNITVERQACLPSVHQDLVKAREENEKYELKCPLCGQVFKFSRLCDAVRYPEKYRHKGCDVSLVRVK